MLREQTIVMHAEFRALHQGAVARPTVAPRPGPDPISASRGGGDTVSRVSACAREKWSATEGGAASPQDVHRRACLAVRASPGSAVC